MGDEESDSTYRYLILLLGLATLVLASATVYMMELLGINYGIGLGVAAILQNNSNKLNVTAALAQTVQEVSLIHRSIDEVYIIFLVSLGMLGASFVLYVGRHVKASSISRRYLLMHTTLALVYVALFYVIFSSFQINLTGAYFLILYFAIATVVVIDLYLEFGINLKRPLFLRRGGAVRIDPDTPYSNLIAIRDSVFASLSGNLRIVDKHFNSQAISNLHRLIGNNLRSIKSIEVLTSKEMLDSGFQENYTDFKNELKNYGVELNFMMMSDADSVMQHERFIFDDEKAYKIPPLNIINKKSETIVRIRHGDVKRRFEALEKNAIKYDNYVVKKARSDGAA